MVNYRIWGAIVVMAFFSTNVALAADERINGLIDGALSRVTETRHHLHANPELSNREFETAALVERQLREFGFEDVRTGIAHTGVVGILRGGQPGPVIAVRADMDALPVTEDTDLPFRSTKRTMFKEQEVGVMHACGHDIHTAVLLGVAEVFAKLQPELPGTVVFIFQPAEEGPPQGEDGGAPMMLAEGVFEDPTPEAVFGMHTYAAMEVGKIGYTSGGALAAVDHFYLTLKGKQAHGAAPHLSVDPIVLGSQVVMALQTIRSRNLSPLEPSVVTVGLMRGGTRFNIIPETVYMEGTVRTYADDVQNQVELRMRQILDGLTLAAGGSYELEYDRITPATINDPALTARMVPSLQRAAGESNVNAMDPWMAGEDFAFFANEVPGFYFRLGTLLPGTESGGHHSPTFRADDAALAVGMRAMAFTMWDYLSGSAR